MPSNSTAQSYVHGTGHRPLSPDTVGATLDRAAGRWPDRHALIVRHQQVRWSWRELQARVDAVAAGLLALGLRPGQRVGIWSPNNAEWILTQFATAKAGLILVNINPAYRANELEFALNHVGCTALIMARRFKSSDYVAMLSELIPEGTEGELGAVRLPDLRHVILIDDGPPAGFVGFDTLATRAGADERRRLEDLTPTLQFDDPINIQFTSGTTGPPKAATLTHHTIVNNALFTADRMRLGPEDRLCIPVPMYHCFGMVLGSLACATSGATMVLPSERFEPTAVLEAVEAERCTALHGVPTMFFAELDDPAFERFDLTSLRTGIMAGAPCPVELMKRVIEQMHLSQITIAYGMTETGPVSFQTSLDDPIERRVTAVGRVLPHTEVKIIDEHGRAVLRGTPGELLTRGYCVMREYWNAPAQTAEAVDAAGWMHSGDLATIDDEGYCHIVGRLKDMVIRGGENIFPREIEEHLYAHPKVDEVEVFGVPDAKYGEEVCAWIKLQPGEHASEDELRAFCRDRLAHFKVPRYIRLVESFPMTVTGKVQKFRMREQMISELRLEEPRTM